MGKVLTNKRIKDLNPDYDYSRIPPELAGENRCQVAYVFLALNLNKLTLVDGHALEANQLVPEDLVIGVTTYKYTLYHASGSTDISNVFGIRFIRVYSSCKPSDGNEVKVNISVTSDSSWLSVLSHSADTYANSYEEVIAFNAESNTGTSSRTARMTITQEDIGGNPSSMTLDIVQSAPEVTMDTILGYVSNRTPNFYQFYVDFTESSNEVYDVLPFSDVDLNPSEFKGDWDGALRISSGKADEVFMLFLKDPKTGRLISITDSDVKLSTSNYVSITVINGGIEVRNLIDYSAGNYGSIEISLKGYPVVYIALKS